MFSRDQKIPRFVEEREIGNYVLLELTSSGENGVDFIWNSVYFRMIRKLKGCLFLFNFRFAKHAGIMSNVHVKIDLSFQQLTDIVKQLSPSEKLKLNDVIWDENMEVPDEHQKIVLGRVKKSRQNPGRMLDWNKAARTLKP